MWGKKKQIMQNAALPSESRRDAVTVALYWVQTLDVLSSLAKDPRYTVHSATLLFSDVAVRCTTVNDCTPKSHSSSRLLGKSSSLLLCVMFSRKFMQLMNDADKQFKPPVGDHDKTNTEETFGHHYFFFFFLHLKQIKS